MAANLFKRGTTYWWRAMIDGTTHRRSTGQKDYDLAKKAAREMDRAVRAGESRVKMRTFGEQVLHYFEHGAKIRKGADRRDPPLLKPAVLAWRDRPLDSIRRSDCERFLAELQASEMSVGMVWLVCTRVKLMFQIAIEDGLLTTHPWPGGKKGVQVPRPELRERVLTRDEEAALHAKLEAHWARLITVAIGTGLRRKELLNITPAHRVDGQLRIPGSMTKNKKSRNIPLRPEVAAALDGQTPSPDFLGRYWPYSRDTATDVLRRTAKKLGWPQLTLHDLRRTFGTRCAEGGMSLPHLQKLMGHSNPKITADFYIRLGESSVRDSLLKIAL